nr:serpin family protein [Pseudarthrobacter sp. NBSH8]
MPSTLEHWSGCRSSYRAGTAVTQINGAVSSAPPGPERSISFNRPFHYQIVHVETGLPLFMGTVADPR